MLTPPRAALGALVVVAVALAARSLGAQQLADRGALMLRHGTDTVVTDRFIRTPESLVGSVLVKGQGRIDYTATLGPGETVRSITISAFAPGADASSAPMQRIRVVMQSDTAIVETPAGLQRVPTKAGAIPMFNNALALMELFTRRARPAALTADIPFFSLAGGATLMMVVRPFGTDSATATVANQVHRLKLDAVGRIAGGAIPSGGFEILRAGPDAANGLDVATPTTPITPPKDYSAPPGAPYTAEEVRVKGPGGIVLGGTLTKPIGARAPVPAVITITGSGQQDRDEYLPFAGGIRMMRQIADTLSRRGIAVLRLDDRAVGASTGDASSSTTADYADDMRAALAYLRTRNDIDGKRIALVGHSEGGMIAPMVAATDRDLKAIVTLGGPGEAMIEMSMAQNKYIVDHDTTLTPAVRDSLLRAARISLQNQTNPWTKFAMAFDVTPSAKKVTVPALILQGATDRQVPVDQADKLAAAIRSGGNADVTVRIFPATNHLFIADADGNFANYDKLKTNKVSPEILGVIADWLVLKLK